MQKGIETVGSIVVLILVWIGSGKELGLLQQIPVQMGPSFMGILVSAC